MFDNNYNIIISYCTLFREKWDILASLVSLDLLVLMVSLWVLHSSICKHTEHEQHSRSNTNWKQLGHMAPAFVLEYSVQASSGTSTCGFSITLGGDKHPWLCHQFTVRILWKASNCDPMPWRDLRLYLCILIDMLIQNVCLLRLSPWLSREPLVSEESQGSQALPEKKYKPLNNLDWIELQRKEMTHGWFCCCFYRDPVGLMATKAIRGDPVLRYKAIHSFNMLQGEYIRNHDQTLVTLWDYVHSGSKGFAWIARSAWKVRREGRENHPWSFVSYIQTACEKCASTAQNTKHLLIHVGWGRSLRGFDDIENTET